MSLHDYIASIEISVQDPPFYALIMAAFRKADTHNLRKLQRAFPGKWDEFLARYTAPGGLLEGERIPCPDTTGWLEDEGVCLREDEYPEGDLEQLNKLEPLEGQWEGFLRGKPIWSQKDEET